VTTTADPQTPAGPLVKELLARIDERVPADRARAVHEFALAYVRRISAEAVQSLTAEELFGQVMGVFDLADRRGSAPFVVRAFNPTLAGDGYATVGSVVETNCEDSPFLVDSVSEELTARGLDVRLVVHPVVGVERGPDSRIRRVLHAREAAIRESVMHFEVGRHLGAEELADLTARIERILGDVQAAVRDFHAMAAQVPAMVEAAQAATGRFSEDEIEEATLFLWWLADGNFVFLGYREYSIDEATIRVGPHAGLGILSHDERSRFAEPVALDSLDEDLRERLMSGSLLDVSKTNRFATVHRRVKMEDITVKRVAADGSVAGHMRLVGLFTRKAYMAPASRIPILSRKLRQIAAAEDLLEDSHDHKTLVELFESFPKDELFAATVVELRATLMRLLDLQERRNIQLFVRPDLPEGRVAVLVALPRDRFNAELRVRLQDLLLTRFNGSSVDYHLSLGESDQALMHFAVHVDGGIPDVSFTSLEQEVVALARTWDDRLRERLASIHGEERGNVLADRYEERFPDYYKASTDVYLAVVDIEHFERLDAGEPFVVGLKNEREAGQSLTRVGLYKTGGKVRLSDFMPILRALGLTVVEEVPTRLVGGDGETFLHDFGVLGEDDRPLELAECGDRVAECIAAVSRGECESDSLNRLVISAGLTWRQVAVLRAYRTYRLRVGASFTLEYMNEAYARNPQIARQLVRLFELRFDSSQPRDPEAEEALRDEILADFEGVKSLDEDLILRAELGLIDATVRTNAFQRRAQIVRTKTLAGVRLQDLTLPRLAFKFGSARVPDMPKPCPLYEIFVYSPRMEGIHLRGGKVARGGIRWSDRREDYRTEILGLMKAQMVKNAVIVPVGSKGGFVLKRDPATKEERAAEVVEQYSTLIRGMLDLTDNRVGGEIVHPPDVRVLDEDDPYLVVAADRGTATFSDTANAIAAEYGFWLGDAFASGGSTGYDHKELGITAKGVWESVKRHFRELGHDVMAQPTTTVGIGDMSGDVFGNGMLYTDTLELVAAFDHRHVFVDPTPDTEASAAERKRLFELPASSWDDYDRSLISPGGGVFSRQAKSIPISAEMREALGIDASVVALTPNELISAILRAPVDLLWNGGIGTFVKASYESHADVGDRSNDAVRVDGDELRARVVAEGGNLGFTQKGRIEYAEAGGRINTDAIDNSAGVDCSDHEVNLKILLGIAVAAGDLTLKQRDDLLREVEQDVARHVLYDNYLQAQILSQESLVSHQRLDEYELLMEQLEAEDGHLDRALESLPTAEQIAERRSAGASMPRPELCILLAYAKRSLEEAIRSSSLPDDPHLDADARGYFPPAVVERFGHLIAEHPLRRELVGTILANAICNDLGITFASRLAAETGAEAAEIARACRIAREVTDAVARWDDVEALDGLIDPVVQNTLMVGVDTLVEDVARWYLLNETGAPLGETIAEAAPLFAELSDVIDKAGSDAWRSTREQIAAGLVRRGVDERLARRHAVQPELAHAPDIIAVSKATGRTVEDVASMFFLVGERLHLDWLEREVLDLPGASSWDGFAARAIADDLMSLRRDAAVGALRGSDTMSVDAALDAYLAGRAEAVDRLERLVESLAAQEETSLARLTVALRQVRTVLG
jgi:glutamate dehydrogenase